MQWLEAYCDLHILIIRRGMQGTQATTVNILFRLDDRERNETLITVIELV